MINRQLVPVVMASALMFTPGGVPSLANEAQYIRDGKYYDADDRPTYRLGADGQVDWHTYSGYRRYHESCHVCHGADGDGAAHGSALTETASTMDYFEFVDIVMNGRNAAGKVMPAFGTNPQVYCFVDDVYIYLRARGAGAVPRGRPSLKAEKPDAAIAFEKDCLGKD